MANTGDVNVGSVLRYNGELCLITEWQHRTPGNLRAFYQAKMRNLMNGKQTENRFRSGEEVTLVRVEYKMMQFIYTEGDFIVVMDNETFDQVHIPATTLGDGLKFLKEGMEIKVTFEEDTPIKLITQVKPSVLVKGGDYTRDQVVGHELVEAAGGEVLLVDVLPGFSTTSLVDRARGGKG